MSFNPMQRTGASAPVADLYRWADRTQVIKTIQVGCMLALIGVLCSACAGINWVHEAPRTLDARAKSFSVPPGTSSIYVIYVGNHWWAGGQVADVFLDGACVGTVERGIYRLYPVTPMKHSVGEGRQYVNKEIVLTTEAGKSYFIRIREYGGSFVRPPRRTIEVVEEAEGRDLVLKSKLGGEFRGLVQ